MLSFRTALFLSLILLVVCGESKASVEVTANAPRCSGYWDLSSGNYHCSPQPTGVVGPNGRSPPPTPVSPTPVSRPARVASARTQVHEAPKDAVSSSTTESGTSRPPPDSDETSPTVSIQPNDGVNGRESKDQLVQPPDNSRVSESATSPVADPDGQEVEQTVQELGTTEQRNAKGNIRESGKGEKVIAGDKAQGPNSGSVGQPLWSVVTQSGQSYTVGVAAVGVDVQESTENGTQGVRSVAKEIHSAMLSAALGLMSF